MKFKLSYVYFVTVIVWIILLIPAIVSWRDSVPFLVFLSWYANFTTDLGNWMTARTKERTDDSDGDSP
jgi:hypothetical protein